MKTKTKYILGGILAIVLSYISAVMGSEYPTDSLLGTWHIMFSIVSGMATIPLFVNGLTEL